jgi:hypothetical protein
MVGVFYLLGAYEFLQVEPWGTTKTLAAPVVGSTLFTMGHEAPVFVHWWFDWCMVPSSGPIGGSLCGKSLWAIGVLRA